MNYHRPAETLIDEFTLIRNNVDNRRLVWISVDWQRLLWTNLNQ